MRTSFKITHSELDSLQVEINAGSVLLQVGMRSCATRSHLGTQEGSLMWNQRSAQYLSPSLWITNKTKGTELAGIIIGTLDLRNSDHEVIKMKLCISKQMYSPCLRE